MRDLSKIKYVVVHKHPFHCDDVMTVAYIYTLMEKLYGKTDLEFIRTFNPTEDMTFENGYLVADVGKGEFDHHFEEAEKKRRPDGVAYAAFGLVVKEFHEGLLTEAEYEKFDRKFIEPLDDHDNNGTPNSLTSVFHSMNAKWDDEDSRDSANIKFKAAVILARKMIDNYIDQIKSEIRAEVIGNAGEIKYNTVWLSQYAPVYEMFADHEEVLFMGSDNKNRGVYTVQALRTPDGSANKALFPERFRGYGDKYGTPNEFGMTFCHSSGFLASFTNEETARDFMYLLSNGAFDNKDAKSAVTFEE